MSAGLGETYQERTKGKDVRTSNIVAAKVSRNNGRTGSAIVRKPQLSSTNGQTNAHHSHIHRIEPHVLFSSNPFISNLSFIVAMESLGYRPLPMLSELPSAPVEWTSSFSWKTERF